MPGHSLTGSDGHVDKEHTVFVSIHHQIHEPRLWKDEVNEQRAAGLPVSRLA
jgi:hypothetical protein